MSRKPSRLGPEGRGGDQEGEQGSLPGLVMAFSWGRWWR